MINKLNNSSPIMIMDKKTMMGKKTMMHNKTTMGNKTMMGNKIMINMDIMIMTETILLMIKNRIIRIMFRMGSKLENNLVMNL
jgi:hypothetical protein